MSNRIIIIGLFLLSVSSEIKSQTDCDKYVTDVLHKQKHSLANFWSGLRLAINRKDKNAMSHFFQFPFNGAPINSKDSNLVVVTKKKFLLDYYKVFLIDNLTKIVNSKMIDEVLTSAVDDRKTCQLNIAFPIINPSRRGEGIQAFMTIKEIGTVYKVSAVWTVP